MLKVFLVCLCQGQSYLVADTNAKNTKLEAEINEIKAIIEDDSPQQTQGEWETYVQVGYPNRHYRSTTSQKVRTTGYWAELCEQLDDIPYYSTLYASQEVYLCLALDPKFQSELSALCQKEVPPIDIQRLYDNDGWEFKVPDKVISINGKLTLDIELFFNEKDVGDLFNWEKQQFVRICEFAAGQLQVDQEQPDNSNLGIQQCFTSLELFNYLSEIEQARARLYQVCKHSSVGQDFHSKYPTLAYFDLLFN